MKRLLLALTVVGFIFFLAAPATVVAQELTAEDYVNFWQPLVGTWRGTAEVGGESTPITFRFRVSPNKKCLLLYDDSDGVPGTQQLQVYDPVAKQEIAWGVDKDGQRQIQTIVVNGMKKGMKAAKGVGGTWEIKLSTNDGQTIMTKGKWAFVKVDETHVVMEWTDLKEDDKAKPDTKMTLERQPERERRAKQ